MTGAIGLLSSRSFMLNKIMLRALPISKSNYPFVELLWAGYFPRIFPGRP